MLNLAIGIVSPVISQLSCQFPLIINTVRNLLANPIISETIFKLSNELLKTYYPSFPIIDDSICYSFYEKTKDIYSPITDEDCIGYLSKFTNKLPSLEFEMSKQDLLAIKLTLIITCLNSILFSEIQSLINIVLRNPELYEYEKIKNYVEYFENEKLEYEKLEEFYSGGMSKLESVDFSKRIIEVEKVNSINNMDNIRKIIDVQKYGR